MTILDYVHLGSGVSMLGLIIFATTMVLWKGTAWRYNLMHYAKYGYLPERKLTQAQIDKFYEIEKAHPMQKPKSLFGL